MKLKEFSIEDYDAYQSFKDVLDCECGYDVGQGKCMSCNQLQSEQVLKPKDLIGKSFVIIKSDNKKLGKRKKPFTLVWDRWGNKTPTDSKGRFSFAYLDTILKGSGDLLILRQLSPTGRKVDTILKRMEFRMDYKKLNESLEEMKSSLTSISESTPNEIASLKQNLAKSLGQISKRIDNGPDNSDKTIYQLFIALGVIGDSLETMGRWFSSDADKIGEKVNKLSAKLRSYTKDFED